MPEEQNQSSKWTPETLVRLKDLLTQFRDAEMNRHLQKLDFKAHGTLLET